MLVNFHFDFTITNSCDPNSEDFNDYALKVSDQIKKAGISSIADLKNHNLNYKIRSFIKKSPFINL